MARTRKRAAAEATCIPGIQTDEILDVVSAGETPKPKRESVELPKGWEKASKVLDKVESVRTIFPSFNEGTKVGGLPIRRLHTVHGATHSGKSAYVLGLIRSFLAGGHFAAFIDAEYSTPEDFARQLITDELYDSDRFLAKRPKSYEDTIESVDAFLKMVREYREKHPEVKSIIVVDSINKLVPEREMAKLLASDGGDEAAKGHWGRYRAALNQTWIDHLTPLIAAADCAFVVVAQERKSQESGFALGMEALTIKGGSALTYEASLLIQVAKSSPIREPPNKEGEIVGFAHRVRIHKSKVGNMDGHYTDCSFRLSNGKFAPPGFDLARDLLVMAQQLEIVKVSGSWLSWNKRRWQGQSKASAAIAKDPAMLNELASEVNARVDENRK